jgi:hypothetical protein
MLKDYSDPRHRPITLREIRDEEAAEQRRRQEGEEKKVRDAENALTANHRRLLDLSKKEVLDGRPDPEFQIPESVKARRMTVKQALKFAEAESARFVAETSEYFRSDKNSTTITNYLFDQGVQIPDAQAYKLAFERCRYLGLLEEKLEVEPQTGPVEQPEVIAAQPQDAGLTAGWDIETGEPRRYSQKEIWKMSSLDMKKAFRMWADKDGEDRRPKINRSMYL